MVEEGWVGSLGLYIKWINKVLLRSTENYIHDPVINHNRK